MYTHLGSILSNKSRLKGGRKINYYEILGVSTNAKNEEIRKKYLELVKIFHPDKCKAPDANKKFIEIKKAYSILKDPQKRAEYDKEYGFNTKPNSPKPDPPKPDPPKPDPPKPDPPKPDPPKPDPNYQKIPGKKDKTLFRNKLIIGIILFFMIFGGWTLLQGNKEGTHSLNSEVKVEKPNETYTNSIGMEFVQIPHGDFMMGSSDEKNSNTNDGPVHKVRIEKSFYLGKFEVTQKQWLDVMGNNPSYFKGDSLPVESVSWEDTQKFIERLNEKEGTNKYRLPSEAEWEYACRAGTTTSYSFGGDESKIGDYAWYNDNSGDKTHPVGLKKPNLWSLYDMDGNVWEMCQDTYHDDYDGAPSDGSVWKSGNRFFRVRRGGVWYRSAKYCNSAARGKIISSGSSSTLGFRVLMEC